ncbi:hypothetical protein Taro_001528 [Colocasia esculenta]|uniref:Uncharacterized protein n=1 Tax=Colocasia esculenta TaxID=4460 RepID=A0A843TKY7_COLES|nr:hypothetical protein [Colocasia esculenta]
MCLNAYTHGDLLNIEAFRTQEQRCLDTLYPWRLAQHGRLTRHGEGLRRFRSRMETTSLPSALAAGGYFHIERREGGYLHTDGGAFESKL